MANISVSASSILVKGTSANDSINCGYGRWHVTIEAGSGNDTIYSNGNYNMLDGGEGDDTIYQYSGSSNTIYGGFGNDTNPQKAPFTNK